MSDWKIVGATTSTGFALSGIGDGLAEAAGVLAAKVTSGLEIDGSGNIVVKNGSGIAIDGSGSVTVNAGVGLTVSGGFLQVNPGAGLTTSGGQIVIPGGAITNAMLQALSVSTANIQAGAVGATQIANAAITTAKIGAAQITTALIANGAITNALIGTAAVGTANIQNAAVTSAIIANLAVGNAHISDLSASKITAGTISASVSMTAPDITSTGFGSTVHIVNGNISIFNSSTETFLNNGIIQVSALTGSAGLVRLLPGEMDIITSGAVTVVKVSETGGVEVNSSPLGTNVAKIDTTGKVTCTGFKTTGIPQFGGTNSTAAATASLGSNCPAGTNPSQPYTWIEVQAADGTLGWVPMWN